MSLELVQKMLSGDRLSLSRLISLIENRSKELPTIMAKVQEHIGHAECLGITGPPGAGKSTLVDRLIAHFRKEGKKVGVIAIDPSSPFSGGAVLGDRIRMQDHAGDEGVFIRSLGSRGSQGGLSRATREVVKLYDAFGMDIILVETVGVGQTELDIMEIAETTIVLMTPESGDAIQTLKAGITEIADIFVINKSDRDGALMMQAELQAMIELGIHEKKWQVPVLLVQANKDVGVAELVQASKNHQEHLKKSEKEEVFRKKQKIAKQEVFELLSSELEEKLKAYFENHQDLEIKNPYQTSTDLTKVFFIVKS